MSFYATKNYPGLVAENPSLVIAFCHLLTSFGKAIDPESLADFLNDYTDPLSLESVSKYDGEVKVTTTGTGWPTSKNSIIGFRIMGEDDVPYTLYCLVFDPQNMKFIDSRDGTVTSSGVFGEPSEYATYVFNPKEPEVEEVVDAAPSESDRTYVVLKGERLFQIARKLGISEEDLLDHNDIPDHYNLRTGQVLHLPIAQPKVEKPQTTYDIFDSAKQMHVTREGGAQKWHFGKHDSAADIISGSGMYDEGTEVWVHGLATVPVDGELWAYYLDAVALGEARTTGTVRYAIGFAFNDLADGPKPPPTISEDKPVEEAIAETIAAVEPEEAPAVIWQHEPDEVLHHPTKWKSTWEEWKIQQTYIVDLPEDEEEVLIYDAEGNRPNKRIKNNGNYVIAGTFWKDGIEYGRPLQCLQIPTKPWYGIPMSLLKSEAEIYSTDLELADRLALKQSSLTKVDKYIIPALAVTNLSYERLKLYGKRLAKKHKERIK